jgi:hypothetical protein
LPAVLALNKALHPDLHRPESTYQTNAFPHSLDPNGTSIADHPGVHFSKSTLSVLSIQA